MTVRPKRVTEQTFLNSMLGRSGTEGPEEMDFTGDNPLAALEAFRNGSRIEHYLVGHAAVAYDASTERAIVFGRAHYSVGHGVRVAHVEMSTYSTPDDAYRAAVETPPPTELGIPFV